jgi:hypothetical protein
MRNLRLYPPDKDEVHRTPRTDRPAALAGCGSGRSGGWGCRTGGSALIRGCGCLGLCRSGRGVRFSSRLSGLRRVVVHIPACSLEVQARRGQRALKNALAHGAHKLLFGAEVLDLLKTVTALSTPIRIQRQSSHPPERMTRFTYCIGRAANHLQNAALPHSFFLNLNARQSEPMPSGSPMQASACRWCRQGQ